MTPAAKVFSCESFVTNAANRFDILFKTQVLDLGTKLGKCALKKNENPRKIYEKINIYKSPGLESLELPFKPTLPKFRLQLAINKVSGLINDILPQNLQ